MSQNNPFDFSKLFTQMDPAKMATQFQEMLAGIPFAHIDPAVFAESQRKNFETLIEANQAAVSGAQTLLQRQSEMMQNALTEAADALKTAAGSDSVETAKKNADQIEVSVERAMDNFTEIAGMVQQVYSEVSEKVEQRMKENIDELRENLSKVN